MYLTKNQLFFFYGKINSIVSLFIPISIVLFYTVTSGLMFDLLDVEYNRKKLLEAIAFSLIPVLIICTLYLIVLFDLKQSIIPETENLEDLDRHTSVIGLNLNNLKPVNIVSWATFYLIYVLSIKDVFQTTLLKSALACLLPTSIVVAIKHLFL